jgi:hypothetical protein
MVVVVFTVVVIIIPVVPIVVIIAMLVIAAAVVMVIVLATNLQEGVVQFLRCQGESTARDYDFVLVLKLELSGDDNHPSEQGDTTRRGLRRRLTRKATRDPGEGQSPLLRTMVL